MINSIDDFYSLAAEAANKLNTFSTKHDLQGKALADHICYKCDSKETFERMRGAIEPFSKFIYQSIVSNRRVAFLKLKKEIQTILGPISLLELSENKPRKPEENKIHHIEIFSTSLPYEDLVHIFVTAGENVVEDIRPHHTTHDIEIDERFLVRITHEPILEKIKFDEMV